MSDDDWDVDIPATKPAASTPAPAVLPPKPAANKWAGEDEDDNDDDWDVSDSEKKPAPKAKAAAPAAAPKKKMTLKQRLAEKERLANEKSSKGEVEDMLIDERTEQDRRREAREKELAADLAVASDLMGDMDLDRTDAIKAVLTANPKTKADFNELSRNIIAGITSQYATNALYAGFVEQLVKDLAEPLTAVQTRKVSSAVSVLGNTKQAEERERLNPKKKSTSKAKPTLGASTKGAHAVDLDAYDDVLDDDDFM